MSNESSIVSKVWSFASVHRDDGVGYGDYLEQLTCLLFLKMVDKFARPSYNRKINVPEGYDWEIFPIRIFWRMKSLKVLKPDWKVSRR